MTPSAAEADDEEEGGARCAAPPRPSSGLCHVPIPIRCRHVATLIVVFQRVGQIRAIFVVIVRLHPEEGNVRKHRVLPLLGGGGVVPHPPPPRWGRNGGMSPDDDVQRGKGNENEYLVPYFLRIRRCRRGRDCDGRRRRKGGGGRRCNAMDPPLPNLGGP